MPKRAANDPAWRVVVPFMALLLAFTWYVRHNGFFWDNILLASKYGQWYYQARFTSLFVPADLAGYPPLFGMYLAAGWLLLGKTVAVSHFLMLPFLLGIVWQVYLLAKAYLPAGWWFWGLLLVWLDPTVLAQSAQVAPDIVLLFLYLVCLNALLRQRPWLLVVALAFMALHTPRSQVLLLAIFCTHLGLYWLRHRSFSWRILFKQILPYVPAALLLGIWLGLHYQHFGWIGYSRASDWGAYAAFVGLKDFFRNGGLIIWRLLDFGRVALWLTAATLLWLHRKHLTQATRELLLLLLVPFLTLSGVLVWFLNPIGHRYYLVVYVLLGLLTAHLLAKILNATKKKIIYVALAASLVSGHFWLYPPTVAKGWDATLAHLPYFKLRHQMLTYLDQQQIDWQEVGSDFPNLASPADTDLTQDLRQFPAKDLGTHRYILYSNVFNGFNDQELAALEHDWRVQHELRAGQVIMRLYRRAE